MSTDVSSEPVKCSVPTLNTLKDIITGDSKISPHRTGSMLVQFFNQFGIVDTSVGGSRGLYTKDCLTALNGTKHFLKVLEAAADPREFFDSEHEIEVVVTLLNRYLEHDGYHLKLIHKKYQLRPLNTSKIVTPFNRCTINQQFIDEQLEKCDQKIASKDFDGAITNARSLVEAVLLGIEERITKETPTNDGDLPKLYNRVRKIINLDSKQEGIPEFLQEILRGLTNIVNGIAALRNKMSDAHARTYKPAEHHAHLAVNAAKTLTAFIFDTVLYQEQKNKKIASQVEKKAV